MTSDGKSNEYLEAGEADSGNRTSEQIIYKMSVCNEQMAVLGTIDHLINQLIEAKQGDDYHALLERLADECEHALSLGGNHDQRQQ